MGFFFLQIQIHIPEEMRRLINDGEIPKYSIIRQKRVKFSKTRILGLTLPSFRYYHYFMVTDISTNTIELIELNKTPDKFFVCSIQTVDLSNLDLFLDFELGVSICKQQFAMKEDEKSIETRKKEMMSKQFVYYSLNEDIGNNCKSVAFYIRYGVKNIAPIKKELIQLNGFCIGSLVVWGSKYINFFNFFFFKSGFNSHKKN